MFDFHNLFQSNGNRFKLIYICLAVEQQSLFFFVDLNFFTREQSTRTAKTNPIWTLNFMKYFSGIVLATSYVLSTQ